MLLNKIICTDKMRVLQKMTLIRKIVFLKPSICNKKKTHQLIFKNYKAVVIVKGFVLFLMTIVYMSFISFFQDIRRRVKPGQWDHGKMVTKL